MLVVWALFMQWEHRLCDQCFQWGSTGRRFGHCAGLLHLHAWGCIGKMNAMIAPGFLMVVSHGLTSLFFRVNASVAGLEDGGGIG